MGDNTIFSAKMVECAADGTNSALEITRPKKVAFASDGLLLGPQRFPYSDLLEVAVAGNLLRVALRDRGGRRSERHFRYDTFLPGTGAKRLAELAERLAAENIGGVTAGKQAEEPVARAERFHDRPQCTVRIYGTRVAFPAVCPQCMNPASRAAELPVSSGLDSAVWVVPVCPEHPGIDGGIAVSGWSQRATHLDFVLQRPDYGERFLRLNAEEARPNEAEVRAALAEINAGTRFVVFSYAVSLLVLSFKRASGVCVVAPGRSRLLAGLPYSVLSLLLGWWGIPHGPIFTIASLVTNFRGGVDVTPHLAAVIRGQRLPAVAS